jgi:cytoplasmic iron level regulating protein YaaA (DUF328/UPF0246 family)
MLILLPPSEAKSSGGSGTPLRARLAAKAQLEALAASRLAVLSQVADLCADDPVTARRVLQLPAGVGAEILEQNVAALDARTRPALQRYCGVLYDGLAAATLSPAAKKAAARRVRIFSGGFGVLRGDEMVPAYRIPVSASLPGLGALAAFWRPTLDEVLAADVAGSKGIVVDLRSADYAGMWAPGRAYRPRLLTVRILSERIDRDGEVTAKVISYNSKFAKGELTRALLESAEPPRNAADVADLTADLGWRPTMGTRAGRPALDVVIPLVL